MYTSIAAIILRDTVDEIEHIADCLEEDAESYVPITGEWKKCRSTDILNLMKSKRSLYKCIQDIHIAMNKIDDDVVRQNEEFAGQ